MGEDLSLGAMLKWRRRLLGLTVADAARAAGWSKSSLSQVERGKQVARDARLTQLEDALRMNRGDLLRLARLERAHEDVRAAARRGEREEGPETSRVMGTEVEFVGEVAAGSFASPHGALCDAHATGEAPSVQAPLIRWPYEVEAGSVAARVVGEGMRPAYEEGDLVVFGASERAGAGVASGADFGVRLMPEVGGNAGHSSGLMLARVYVDGVGEGAGMRVRLQALDGRVTPIVVRVGEVAELRRVVGFVRRVG